MTPYNNQVEKYILILRMVLILRIIRFRSLIRVLFRVKQLDRTTAPIIAIEISTFLFRSLLSLDIYIYIYLSELLPDSVDILEARYLLLGPASVFGLPERTASRDIGSRESAVARLRARYCGIIGRCSPGLFARQPIRCP